MMTKFLRIQFTWLIRDSWTAMKGGRLCQPHYYFPPHYLLQILQNNLFEVNYHVILKTVNRRGKHFPIACVHTFLSNETDKHNVCLFLQHMYLNGSYNFCTYIWGHTLKNWLNSNVKFLTAHNYLLCQTKRIFHGWSWLDSAFILVCFVLCTLIYFR
jgi:hypothetical protein